MVDPHISDLFFNSDLEDCKNWTITRSGREFEGYDHHKLREEAEFFLAHIDAIVHGSIPVPTIDELLADFYNRL